MRWVRLDVMQRYTGQGEGPKLDFGITLFMEDPISLFQNLTTLYTLLI